MKMTSYGYYAALLSFGAFLVMGSCKNSHGGKEDQSSNGGSGLPPVDKLERFAVYNGCNEPVWLHQDDAHKIGNHQNFKLQPGAYLNYQIPDEGFESFRLVPRLGCDEDGTHCDIGESDGSCSRYNNYGGCQPPIDSKIEATFGCMDKDNNCAVKGSSYINGSAVDGFTIPFEVKIYKSLHDETNPACESSSAFHLNKNECPEDENLSTNELYKQYDHVNLKVLNPDPAHLKNHDHALVGCFAPHTALTYPTWGGHGVGKNDGGSTNNPPFDDRVIFYSNPYGDCDVNGAEGQSCPKIGKCDPKDKKFGPNNNAVFRKIQEYCRDKNFPDVGDLACGSCAAPENVSSKIAHGLTQTRDGYHFGHNLAPILNTHYVNYVHTYSEVYAWQYDDAKGTRVCNSPHSKVLFVLCSEKNPH